MFSNLVLLLFALHYFSFSWLYQMNEKPKFTNVISIHYKPRIAVAFTTCSEWRWLEVGEKWKKKTIVMINQFHKKIALKTLVLGKLSHPS